MFDYCFFDFGSFFSRDLLEDAVNIIISYFFIGSIFWAPISFYVCWFLSVNDFEIDDKISVRSMYYLGAVLLWPFVLKAAVDVSFDGLVDGEYLND